MLSRSSRIVTSSCHTPMSLLAWRSSQASCQFLSCPCGFIRRQLKSSRLIRHVAEVEQRTIAGTDRGCIADRPLRSAAKAAILVQARRDRRAALTSSLRSSAVVSYSFRGIPNTMPSRCSSNIAAISIGSLQASATLILLFPFGYFDAETEQRLARFQERTRIERNPALMAEFPRLTLRRDIATGTAAKVIFRNGLRYLASH